MIAIKYMYHISEHVQDSGGSSSRGSHSEGEHWEDPSTCALSQQRNPLSGGETQ